MLSTFFNSLNYSTDIQSGAIDVVVVKQPDGTFKCTPFHVRFGRLKLLRSKEKIIRIMVNGTLTSICMKIGEAGEAYFVQEVPEGSREQVRAELISSPLTSPAVSPTEMLRQLEMTHKQEQQQQQQNVNEMLLVAASAAVNTAVHHPPPPPSPPMMMMHHNDEFEDDEVASISAYIEQGKTTTTSTPTTTPPSAAAAAAVAGGDPLVEERLLASGKVIFRPIHPHEKQAIMMLQQQQQQSSPSSPSSPSAESNNTSSSSVNSSSIVVSNNGESLTIMENGNNGAVNINGNNNNNGNNSNNKNWSWGWGELPVKFSSWLGFQRANGGASNSGSISSNGDDFTIRSTPLATYKEQQFLETLAKDYRYDAVHKTYILDDDDEGEEEEYPAVVDTATSLSASAPSSSSVSLHVKNQSSSLSDEFVSLSLHPTKPSYAAVAAAAAAAPSQQKGSSSAFSLTGFARRMTTTEQPPLGAAAASASAGGAKPADESEEFLLDEEEDETDFDIDDLSYSESPVVEPQSSTAASASVSAVTGQVVDEDALDEEDPLEKLSSSLTPSLPPHMSSLSSSDNDASFRTMSRSFDSSYLEQHYYQQKLLNKKNPAQLSLAKKSSVSFSEGIVSSSPPSISAPTSPSMGGGDVKGAPSSPPSPSMQQQQPLLSKRRSWKSWFGFNEQQMEQLHGHGSVAPGSPHTEFAGTISPIAPLSPGSASSAAAAASADLEQGTAVSSPTADGGAPTATVFSAMERENGVLYKKSLRPTSEQLQSLGLRFGRNEIQFIVSSRFQGTQEVVANMYLWNHDAKVVISDVDGTITRSDALGHILPMLGRDWSHAGIAKLYSSIRANNYQILYLTSRSIIQAGQTRGYISTLKQGSTSLPEGPVVMAPDRLFQCLAREVITKKPEEFKIAALRDIKALFPERKASPYFAGFGNKLNDAIAYRTVGVPIHKIFTVDPTGNIQVYGIAHEGYNSVHELVHHIFPPVARSSESKKEREEAVDKSFNTWNFFKLDSMSLLSEPLEL